MKYEPSWCGIFHLWHWVTLQGLNFEAFLIWGVWTRVTPLVLKGYPNVMADFSIFFPPNLPMWAALVISLGPALPSHSLDSISTLPIGVFLAGLPASWIPVSSPSTATTILAIHPFTHHPKLSTTPATHPPKLPHPSYPPSPRSPATILPCRA